MFTIAFHVHLFAQERRNWEPEIVERILLPSVQLGEPHLPHQSEADCLTAWCFPVTVSLSVYIT
jgi:hypothetical protein